MEHSEPIGKRSDPTKDQTAIVDANSMPWSDSPYPGIQMKLLWHDEETGASTILFKFAPGAHTPRHEHMGVEQTFVLEGSLADHDGEVRAGNYVVRAAGSVHQAHAPNGSVHIAFFSRKNRMLADDEIFP